MWLPAPDHPWLIVAPVHTLPGLGPESPPRAHLELVAFDGRLPPSVSLCRRLRGKLCAHQGLGLPTSWPLLWSWRSILPGSSGSWQ